LPGALLLLGTAYDKLFKEAQEKHRSVLIKQSHWDRMENLYFGKSEQAKQLATALDLKKVMAPLQELIDTVNTLLLGVDTAKFRRFSQLTPTRIYMMSGRMEHAWNRDPSKLTINDFEFCHEFVVNFGIMDQ
jgi:hypothetical protein